MRYEFFDKVHRNTKPLAALLNGVNSALKSDYNPLVNTKVRRLQSAVLETSVRFLQHYPKQPWQFDDVEIDGKSYPVEHQVVVDKAFAHLVKFRRQGLPENAPKVLFIAALSGHHATLSSGTIETFFPDHEVYITDWLDGKYVPLQEGRFGLEEYISYVIEFLKFIGPDTHVIALCQAGPAGLVAAALMSEQQDPCTPASLSMMASPMNMQVNPGVISKIAKMMRSDIWGLYSIYTVPSSYPGAGRKVYPGLMQLGNFMSMNIRSHIEAHFQFLKDVYQENVDEADKHRDFYDEYFAILDMPAEFCIETLERVFMGNEIAENTFTYKGKKVNFSAITGIPVLAMEGAEDDMVRPGQCNSVIDMLPGLADEMKEAYVQEGVGHYGIFNGSRFVAEVAPKLKTHIKQAQQ